MAVAADVLRAFSESTQVLFFTCHDQQAERLEREATSKKRSVVADGRRRPAL
jgi:uncharacterized protein YhaN